MLAAVGLFGSATAFGASRKFEQPASDTARPSPAAATIRIMRIVCSLWLAVEAHGDHERAGERQVEVIRRANLLVRAGDVGLRIESRVLGPRVQVAPRDAHVDARHA